MAIADEDVPPGSLPAAELQRRQDLARYVERKFPATKRGILDGAREMQAPPEILGELQRLPERTYEGFPEIWETLGGRIEGGRTH